MKIKFQFNDFRFSFVEQQQFTAEALLLLAYSKVLIRKLTSNHVIPHQDGCSALCVRMLLIHANGNKLNFQILLLFLLIIIIIWRKFCALTMEAAFQI